MKKENLGDNLKHVVYNYVLPANEYQLDIDMAVMAVVMQMSRFLCMNRVKVKGERGLEFCNLYAMNFAPSGSGKDASIKSITKIIEKPLAEFSRVKKRDYERRKAELLKGSKDKMLAVAGDSTFKKMLWWHNTFSGGTVQGLYSERAKMADAEIGALHFESSEFLDRLKESNGEIVKLFTYVKDAWEEGNTKTDTIMGGDFRKKVEDIPLTMYVHGSSAGLRDNSNLLNGFMNIFETGMARRSFCIFSTKKIAIEYTEKEYIDIQYDVEKGAIKSREIMNKAFEATHMLNDDVFIGGLDHILAYIIDYKNLCKRRYLTTSNEALSAEVKDRFRKALKLAACLAILEHPEELTIRKEDYKTAVYLTERWGTQFSDFIGVQTNDSSMLLYEYVKNNPGVSKTVIRKELKYGNDSRRLDSDVCVATEMANSRNEEFKAVNGRGVARYYSIIPSHMTDIEENQNNQKTFSSIDIEGLDI